VKIICKSSANSASSAQLEKKISGANRQSGSGSLWKRYQELRKPLVIPKEKLDRVSQLADISGHHCYPDIVFDLFNCVYIGRVRPRWFRFEY
jgi:hypothetical protein